MNNFSEFHTNSYNTRVDAEVENTIIWMNSTANPVDTSHPNLLTGALNDDNLAI